MGVGGSTGGGSTRGGLLGGSTRGVYYGCRGVY